jgi:hypothetical protein
MSKPISKRRAAWLLPAAALLTACSGIPLRQREDAQRDRYHQYAGAPIPQFTYLGRYDSWTAIDRYELVVWTTINDAYLITVQPPCEDLQFTNRIGLTQTANTVSQRFDFVKVHGMNCFIKSIQPVNYLKMKQDRRAEAAAAKAAAPGQKP